MKSIKIYLLPILLFVLYSNQTVAQNDFYNEKKEKEKTVLIVDTLLIQEYFTEKDYNDLNNIKQSQKNNDSEFYFDDEVYHENERKRAERDSFFGEVAAEVIVEVLVNTLFILATCWH